MSLPSALKSVSAPISNLKPKSLILSGAGVVPLGFVAQGDGTVVVKWSAPLDPNNPNESLSVVNGAQYPGQIEAVISSNVDLLFCFGLPGESFAHVGGGFDSGGASHSEQEAQTTLLTSIEGLLTSVRDKSTDGVADNNVGAAVAKTVKTGAGRLLSLSARHTDSSALYLWIFDNTAASGTVLLVPTLIPAAGHVVIGTDFFTTKGLAFTTGITYGFSTSGSSYSAYGTAGNVFATMVYA